jgi:hypothetical protein
MLLDAANDATTDAVTGLDRVLTDRNWPHEAKIYPPFVPKGGWLGAPRATRSPAPRVCLSGGPTS